uniref:Uncharacterized protein n=1 Tax=Anguilla anguilla TaxID=7936 RepID=A0A0E9WJP8_ANGAN
MRLIYCDNRLSAFLNINHMIPSHPWSPGSLPFNYCLPAARAAAQKKQKKQSAASQLKCRVSFPRELLQRSQACR